MDDLPESPLKKPKQNPEESGVNLNDLPVLPFEKIFSYLSLEDRIKCRAVSREWRIKFDFKLKNLFYSERLSGFIYVKNRLLNGAFARNFINSPRISSFFYTFSHSILSSLRHLRLCDLELKAWNGALTFAQTLNSFDHLQRVDLLRFYCFRDYRLCSNRELELNLPMLTEVWLEKVGGLKRLVLDAPRLQEIKLLNNFGSLELGSGLEIVHVEPIEKLTTDRLNSKAVKKLKDLKNLKYLYCRDYLEVDPTFLSYLEQLLVIHLNNRNQVSQLNEQKQRYGRTDLKIFYLGCLLIGQENLARIDDVFGYLTENYQRLADQIPFCYFANYRTIERLAPKLAINILSRCTDLSSITIHKPVRDIQRFLDLLKNFGNIADLVFQHVQPQELFDRLPDHCAIQKLSICIDDDPVPDLTFIFKLRSLICLNLMLPLSIDCKFIRKVFEELKFVNSFRIANSKGGETIDIAVRYPDQFLVWIETIHEMANVRGLDDTMQFISRNRLVEIEDDEDDEEGPL